MTGNDPRADLPSDQLGIMPVVAPPSSGISLPVIGGVAVVSALVLFSVLDSRRRDLEAPRVIVTDTREAPIAPPPALEIPQGTDASEVPYTRYYRTPPVRLRAYEPAWGSATVYNAPPRPVAPLRSSVQQTQDRGISAAGLNSAPPSSVPNRASYTPPIVADRPEVRSAPPRDARRGTAATRVLNGNDRALARMFEHPSDTIMQGTLIPAVLETGFDSSVSGFARAIVSRNVKGFDGTRIVVPRGSHLIGEYQSESGPGQKRALIVWARLVTPGGASIDLASPTTDPVGRGGIEARVNRHFLRRFMNAALQTAVNVGSAVTGRSPNTAIVIAGPNAAGNASQLIPSETYAPTLRVKPGTSISVFVARDLDFSEVENR